MKIDLSAIPDSDLIDEIVQTIKDKEKLKPKKEGKSIIINDLSSRKIKFYTKKVLGKSELPGIYRVISEGDHFKVYYKE